MSIQKHIVDADYKKQPEQLKMNFFESNKSDIYVVVHSNNKEIKELVFASTDKDDVINKLIEFRFKKNIGALKDKKTFSDEYNVMVFKDNKFEKTSM